MVQLPHDLSTCQGIDTTLQKLTEWAAIFADTAVLAEHLAKNLLLHFDSIKNDIDTGINDWNKADYFDFGDEIGAGLVRATGSHIMME